MKLLPQKMTLLTMLLFVCLILFGSAAAGSDTSPSGGEIKIIGPPALKVSYKSTNGKISAMPALFGIPVYNGHFVGALQVNKEHLDACAGLPENYFQSDLSDESTKKIALVERGSCTFVEKVRNCQKAGAKGVVVFDNEFFGFLPVMADDGTGDSVSIPSIIIRNEDGFTLKKYVTDDSGLEVEIEIAWGLPRPDGRVEWEFWTTSEMSSGEKRFVHDLKDVVRSLGETQLFTPHYTISTGMLEASNEDCSNDRKYCMFSPSGITGNQLLRETLTQICVYKAGQDLNDTLLWWDYVGKFSKDCGAEDQKFWDGVCSMTTLKYLAKADNRSSVVKSVSQCIFDSGGLDGQANSLFDAEIQAFGQYGVFWTPAVTINNEWYIGSMICPNPIDIATCSIYAAICAAYAPETIPQICLKHSEIGCPVSENRDVCGVCGGDGRSCNNMKPKSLVLMFLFITLVVVGVGCLIAVYFNHRLAIAEAQFGVFSNMYEPLRHSDDGHQLTME